MREFILRALKAHTSSFDVGNLEDAGKMHIVARCISNALWLAKGLREDTIMHAVLEGPRNPPKLISFYGDKLKGFAFDELGVSKFIKYALEKGENLKLNESLEVHPGIIISKKSFEQFVREKSSNSQIIYMHKKGKNIHDFKFKDNNF